MSRPAGVGSGVRVALVTNQIDKVGGLERYVDELSRRLAELSFDVHIIAKHASSGTARAVERRETGVKVIRVAVPSKRNPLYAAAYAVTIPWEVRSELAALGSQTIVHGHFFAPMVGAALTGTSFIYTWHGQVYEELLDERAGTYVLPAPLQGLAVEIVRRAERKVLRSASQVTVLSEFMAARARQLAGVDVPLEVLPGGVDTNLFSPGRPQRPPWAAGRYPLVLSMARLAPGKGVLELVNAMPEIVSAFPTAMLVVAGSGPDEMPIRARIDALGLEQSVRLIGDQRDEDLVGWIRCVELCVVPTQRSEGFGLSTVEALACGTPVMATSGGGSDEILRSLNPRLLLSGCTPAQLAAGVISVVSDQRLLDDVRASARARVHPLLSWDRVAERWAEIYLNHGRRARAT